MTALTACHVCKSRKCINFDKYCWVNKNNQVYYKLSSGNFMQWNKATNANCKNISVGQPSAYVVKSLYRLKKAERKQKKGKTTKNLFGGTADSNLFVQPMYPC